MSISKRGVGALLLAATGLVALGTGRTSRASADDTLCIPPGFQIGGGPMAGAQIAGVTTWDPLAYEKLLEDFTVESARYAPADRRITWTLKTKKTYAGELGAGEKKLTDFLEDQSKKTFYCGNFYDAERRKIGSAEVFFTIGERAADDRFLVFADLSVANVEVLTAKLVVTLCERPPEVKIVPSKKRPGLE